MTVSKKPPNKPDWLPNWEDETKYPDPKKATGRVWAWEFLRRNPQYQQLWPKWLRDAGFRFLIAPQP